MPSRAVAPPPTTPSAFPDDAPFIAGGEYGQRPDQRRRAWSQVHRRPELPARGRSAPPTSSPSSRAFDTNAERGARRMTLTAVAGETAVAAVAAGASRGSPRTAAAPVTSRVPHRQARAGWLFIAPDARSLLGLFLVRARSCWRCGCQLQRLDRPGRPVLGVGVSVRRTGELPRPAHRARPQPQGLHDSVRNNLYYVLGVVPVQTVLALVLALIVNQRLLKGRTLLPHGVLLPVGRRARSPSR